MNLRSFWPAILIVAFPATLFAQAPTPYQTDFPAEEFRRLEHGLRPDRRSGRRDRCWGIEHDGLPGPPANERVLPPLRDRDPARLSHPRRPDT